MMKMGLFRWSLTFGVLALLSVNPLPAAEGDSLWFQHYDGGGHEEFYQIAPSADNGLLLAGTSNASGYHDLWVVKTDLQGNELFSNSYGNRTYNIFNALIPTSDGGGLLISASYQVWYHNPIMTFRADEYLEPLWSHSTTAGGRKHIVKTLQTRDGGYLLGCNYIALTNYSDIMLIRADSLGQLQWVRRYGVNHEELLKDMVSTEDGGFLLVGQFNTWINHLGPSALLVRIDGQGDTLWTRFYGSEPPYVQWVTSVLSTGDGGFLLTSERSNGAWIIRTDANGDSIWSCTLGQDSTDSFDFVLPAADGGFMLAGVNQSLTPGFVDFWLVKIDEVGNTINFRTYGLADFNENLLSIIPTSDGGYLLGGIRWDASPEPNFDYWLIKTDAQGDSLWSKYYTDYFGGDLLQATDGNYLIGGNYIPPGSNTSDFFLLCLEGSQGMFKAGTASSQTPPNFFNLLPPHPNPFNPSTVLIFELPVPSLVKLEVFDVRGERVGTGLAPVQGGGRTPALQENWYPAGAHQITFDGADLPSGLYFAKLTAGEFTQTQKLVLLK